MASINSDEILEQWKTRQTLAEKMIPLVGELYRDKGLVVRVFGRRLMDGNKLDIIKAHRFARQMVGEELEIADSYKMLEALTHLELSPARIDLGKLCHEFNQKGGDMDAFLKDKLSSIITSEPADPGEPKDVVLYGFGRIGRLVARMLIDRTGGGYKMRLRAIVVRGKGGDLEKRASLLRRDSVHGPFSGTITVDEETNSIIANGNVIRLIYSNSPDEVDYTQYGIKNALVVDNTGIWKDEEGLGLHLKSKGVSKVLLTAPAKGDIKNIVYGVNHKDIAPEDKILCAASCTTNAIVPVLKVLNDEFGIRNGHIETVHSYTNDQNLIDNYHKAERRGRSAPLNMVLTSTGAAKAVAKALPELSGILTGNAIRVPTPNVSMALMSLNLNKSTTKEELNAFLRDKALHSSLQEQIGYTSSTELVSTDLVGSVNAGVVDSAATIVDGDRVVLYVWYDNESGYSSQVIRVMQDLVGLNLPDVP
ncbi:glyceraldehyde-3-phosphate dehydrogenase [Granulosicoccaceae sp. 1_MG-2023]|nr:glyceraldehyde-3-phosphate dehydrogenase [Granulosicoccaceae sp. 1_MG-2023]